MRSLSLTSILCVVLVCLGWMSGGHSLAHGTVCSRQSQAQLLLHRRPLLQQPRSLLHYPLYATLDSSRTVSLDTFHLTPKLQATVDMLRNVPDDKLRYQQLLFLAAQAKPMPSSLKTPENKVPGCLSTVYVSATLDENAKVQFTGDSDAQLTKGLVSLLVNGLSGSTIEEVVAIKPDFIQYAGIAQSLTPGRNNGFLNMLNVMKKQAAALKVVVDSSAVHHESMEGKGPLETSILKKLTTLKPSKLILINESHKHAGHAGIASAGSATGETHFKLEIVSVYFEGLPLVKRHQVIYTLLAQELSNGLHALSISAHAPSELS